MQKTVRLHPPDVPAPTIATIHVDEKAAAKLLEGEESHETAPPAKPAPNAIVTRAAFEAARTSGTWTHDDPSTALWLNSTFAAKGVDADALTASLALHGVVVQ